MVVVMQDQRRRYRYTPYFCEENIWWLARALNDEDIPLRAMRVWLFSNADASIALLNQRAAPDGGVTAWDYHVVLVAQRMGQRQVFDFDTRLAFPTPASDYLAGSFPPQRQLPTKWRAWVREIPAAAYLSRFHSDRRHMQGHLPASAFPDYPVIKPQDLRMAIPLVHYRDMARDLDDESVVMPVEHLLYNERRLDGKTLQ